MAVEQPLACIFFVAPQQRPFGFAKHHSPTPTVVP